MDMIAWLRSRKLKVYVQTWKSWSQSFYRSLASCLSLLLLWWLSSAASLVFMIISSSSSSAFVVTIIIATFNTVLIVTYYHYHCKLSYRNDYGYVIIIVIANIIIIILIIIDHCDSLHDFKNNTVFCLCLFSLFRQNSRIQCHKSANMPTIYNQS